MVFYRCRKLTILSGLVHRSQSRRARACCAKRTAVAVLSHELPSTHDLAVCGQTFAQTATKMKHANCCLHMVLASKMRRRNARNSTSCRWEQPWRQGNAGQHSHQTQPALTSTIVFRSLGAVSRSSTKSTAPRRASASNTPMILRSTTHRQVNGIEPKAERRLDAPRTSAHTSSPTEFPAGRRAGPKCPGSTAAAARSSF